MKLIKSLRKQLKNFDQYQYTLPIPIKQNTGQKSSFGGFLTILYFLLFLAIILYYSIYSYINRNNPKVTTAIIDQSYEVWNFTEADDSQQFIISLFVFDSFCQSLENEIFDISRDCLSEFSFGKLSIVTEIETNFLMPTTETYGVPMQEFIIDCPQAFFSEEFVENYFDGFIGELSLATGYEFADNIDKKMTFCFDFSYSAVFESTPTLSITASYYFDPNFEFSEELYNINIGLIAELEEEYEAEIKIIELEYFDSSIESQITKKYALDIAKTKFDSRVQMTKSAYGRQVLLKSLVIQNVMNYTAEHLTLKPFTTGFKSVDIYLTATAFGEIIFNGGLFNRTEIEFRNRILKSNYGNGYFNRVNRNWSLLMINNIQRYADSRYNLVNGYMLMHLKLNSMHDEIKLEYESIINVFGQIGGLISIITFISIIGLTYNRYVMLSSDYKNFKKRAKISKEAAQLKNLEKNVIDFVLYYFYSCFGFCLKKLNPKSKYLINLSKFEREIFERVNIEKLAVFTEAFKNINKHKLGQSDFEEQLRIAGAFEIFEERVKNLSDPNQIQLNLVHFAKQEEQHALNAINHEK